MQRANTKKRGEVKTLDGTELPKPSIFYSDRSKLGIA